MKPHRIVLALLILLLFTQQAAYAHAISHWGNQTPGKEQLPHSKLCDKCVGFEKLASAAPATPPVLQALALLFTHAARPAYVFNARTLAAFHSRAPPQNL